MNQLNEQQMHQHVTIVGWLHILGNAILIVIGLFLLVLLGGIGAASGDAEAASILLVVGVTLGGFMAVLAIPGIVAGYGLLRRRNWGRILAIIVGLFGLINFPLGTIIGVYTLFVLLQDAAPGYFASAGPESLPTEGATQ